MLKVLGGCCLVLVALATWVAWFLRSVGRQSTGPPEGLAAPLTPDEVRKHRPRTEQDLRALALGPNTARIVELYQRGRLARGALFEHAGEETRVSRNTRSMRFFVRYGWYDASGRLQQRDSDDPAGGLLNAAFDPQRRDFAFIVAYDPASKDHVIFYEDGGVRLAAPPMAPVNVTPPPVAPLRTAPDLSRLEPLLRSAPAQFDDLEALHVLSDRLVELGSPRGEFMALQLARAEGAPPSPRERELLAEHGAAWLPGGTDPSRSIFARGFPVETTLADATSPQHPGWQTIKVLELRPVAPQDPRWTPFEGATPLPRLRELRGATPAWLPLALAAVGAQLEVLHVPAVHAPDVEEVLQHAVRLEHLRTLELEGTGTRETAALIAAVLRRPFQALDRLWLHEPMGDLQPVRAVLETTSRPFTVCLAMDLGYSVGRRSGGVWIEVERDAVRIHQQGAPDRSALTRARALLASVGVDGSRVFT